MTKWIMMIAFVANTTGPEQGYYARTPFAVLEQSQVVMDVKDRVILFDSKKQCEQAVPHIIDVALKNPKIVPTRAYCVKASVN